MHGWEGDKRREIAGDLFTREIEEKCMAGSNAIWLGNYLNGWEDWFLFNYQEA